MTKILFFTSSYPIEGSHLGTFVRSIAENLVKRNIQVRVLVYGTEKQLKRYVKNGVEVIAYPYSWIFTPLLHAHKGLLPTIKKNPLALFQLPFYFVASWYYLIIYSKDVDLIHAHWFVPCGFIAALTKWIHRKHLVTTAWGAEFHLPNNFLVRTLLQFTCNQSDVVTHVSHYLKKQGEQYDLPLEESFVITNGVDLTQFIYERKKHNKIIIGTARRLVTEKHVDDLLQAFSTLDKKVREQCELWILGGGPEEERLKKLALDLTLPNVRFFGHVEHTKVLELLSSMDIFVNPSVQEGMATAVLEAMASRCAVIATKYCAHDEVIDGTNGLLYEPRDIQELKKKLEKLIKDAALRKKLAFHGYKTVHDHYDMQKIVQQYMRVYNDVLERFSKTKM